MSHAQRHPCAVCPKPIGAGFLMCPAHWHLVPRAEQQAVTRHWGRFQRAVDPQTRVQQRSAYLAARDAAIASAQAQTAT